MKFRHGVLGGTFDHIHAGHKRLLVTAFQYAEQVTIGLTTEELYKYKLFANSIETYEVRENSLKQYLEENEYTDRATIVAINDIYGPTITNENFQVIFVTKENFPNVEKVNTKRQEAGLPQLQIITVEDVIGSDGEVITSERIRSGEIDRNGFAYQDIFAKKDKLVLPVSLRETLKSPLDRVVASTEELSALLTDACVIAVGDIVTVSLKKIDRDPDISIIDLRTRRHELSEEERKLLADGREKAFENKPGFINSSFANLFREKMKRYLSIKEKQTIVIDGEEDLLALPAILLAPLQSIVLYGQYDRGIVVNTVTEKLKEKIKDILVKFE